MINEVMSRLEDLFFFHQVNVYVKPPISLPPTADAGKSQV